MYDVKHNIYSSRLCVYSFKYGCASVVELMEDYSRIPTQFVLYESDAVDVSYSDNSRLQVAPCGTTFVFTQPPTDGVHPLHGESIISILLIIIY